MQLCCMRSLALHCILETFHSEAARLHTTAKYTTIRSVERERRGEERREERRGREGREKYLNVERHVDVAHLAQRRHGVPVHIHPTISCFEKVSIWGGNKIRIKSI